jgi:exopolyphosphatase/guanosine-5'-triphosphate,3'-diphosphate pyrophosphatase
VKGREFKALRKEVRRQIEDHRIAVEPVPRFVIASGGTATAVAQMALARQGLSGRPVQGFEMTQAELLHLREAILRRSLAERRQMPGLSPDRADIITAGITILYELLIHLKVNVVRISNRGIRHALLNRLMGRSRPRSRSPFARHQRLSVAESFGRSLRFEQDHGNQVRRLALSTFDQIAGPLRISPEGRDLLEAAALLHDVGYVVGYRQHHKHSYHLISHAHLDGFTPREREIIALVARYHRGSSPRKKHVAWKKLHRDDRILVRQLSALLRIADALDRRHSQGVREVNCQIDSRRVRLTLISNRDLAVEVHGARAKADLFRQVFGRGLTFRTTRSRSASMAGPTPLNAASVRRVPA